MKIAWVTPYSRQSSIGRRSEEIIGRLAASCEVDLWHPETADERPTVVRRRRFTQAEDKHATELADYDLIAYNMGNYLPFHGEIYKLALKSPGVIILHDFVLHHFFAAYYFEELKNPAPYRDAMTRLYGNRGRQIAEGIIAGSHTRIWESDEVVDFPMFEDVLAGADGVITHSNFLADRVRKAFAGPVCTIPLCFEAPSPAAPPAANDLDLPPERTLIVTIGHVNPNKRFESVLKTLGSLKGLVPPFLYVVLGPYDKAYHKRLLDLVRQHNLGDSVRFLGYVSDEVLDAYLRRADLSVNLRYPALEGASGSIVEEMSYGKPTIVTDTGFYRELPDHVVLKISHGKESIELQAALRRLLVEPEERRLLGARALQFARQQFDPASYAIRFLDFAAQVRQARPAIRLADRIASELRDLGVTCRMPQSRSISERAYDLFFKK
ncbi:MAG: glycosyltransferase family 4 protein [Bryobacteraceae bacterium]